ncbi:MAG: hypothetical protein KME09_25325 [Pleurocapsa minor HA4230-MV1]|nr:hypothetical protein [Pleurocapsa minor HA4230-MV1]
MHQVKILPVGSVQHYVLNSRHHHQLCNVKLVIEAINKQKLRRVIKLPQELTETSIICTSQI